MRGRVGSLSARYLLRFDDICPTLNWDVWEEVEKLLTERSLKPIVAVVPKNADPTLNVAPARSDFWSRARRWRELGWEVAMHGFEHRFVTDDPGILGLNRYSEFSGLSAEAQQDKLDQALKAFRAEGIEPRTWVAPAHSFDHTTVELLPKHGLTVISDGFGLYPRSEANGVIWVPQQLWRLRRMPIGVWTVCLHINRWRAADLSRFKSQLDLFRDQIVSMDDVLATKFPDLGVVNSAFGRMYGALVSLKRKRSYR